MEQDRPNHLTPSELGTKQYWEDAYTRELANHTASPEDEGTVWFSDSGAEGKVIDFLDCYADDGVLFKDSLNEYGKASTSFLDLGTGNGHLLFALRDAGWDGLMLGVDYSVKSVELAQQIGKARLEGPEDEDEDEDDADVDDEGKSTQPVHFFQYDIFNPSLLPDAPLEGFDVVLDKGTFDAISLSSETNTKGKRICESYCEKVLPLVRTEGLFIITSCNWTEDELKAWFEKDGSRAESFVMFDKIEYQSFTFGGKKGSSVVTLCFRKMKKE